MNRFHLQYIRETIYELRGGFMVRPLLISMTLGFFGGLFPRIEEHYLRSDPLRIFPGLQPQLAETILSTIAGGVMTVVSIVFAILLMSLTLASMQFSPRILIGFTKDKVTQWTLGVFLGTFSYCVCALPSVKALNVPFVPVVTVEGGMVLALVAVVWLLFFIHHIAHSISVNYIVDRLATETEFTIRAMSETFTAHRPLPHASEPCETCVSTPITSLTSGYIRTIDLGRLIRIAQRNNSTVRVFRRVGHFVPKDIAIFEVQSPQSLDGRTVFEYLSVFDLGPARSLQQDAEFGILQIVDIALRAISPAVNDPSTAINCIDQLGRILIAFAQIDPGSDMLFDDTGTVRVTLPVLGLERMVHSAFDQIRSYSKVDLAVSLRMLRALTDLATIVTDPDVCRMVALMGRRILTGVENTLEPDELAEIRRRQFDLDLLANV